MMMREELSAVARLEKKIAADGHAAVFARYGPTARRFYRAAGLWKNAVTQAKEGRGVVATRQFFHAMYLDIDEACGFTLETVQYLQVAVAAANQTVQRADAGLSESQREYVELSLKVQTAQIVALYMLTLTRGAQRPAAMERLREAVSLIRSARQRYAATGEPAVPRDFDLWAYDVVEGENAGLDEAAVAAEPKAERFCAQGVLDNRLLAFMLHKYVGLMMGGANQGDHSLYPKIKTIAEEMCQLVPDGSKGWYILGWVEKRTENYEASATAYATACDAARDDELGHKCLLRWCHLDAVLFRGKFRAGDVQQLARENSELEASIRSLGIATGTHTPEKALVQDGLRNMEGVIPDAFIEPGLTLISYKTEEEREAKLEALRRTVDDDVILRDSGPGRSIDYGMPKPQACAGCEVEYNKLLKCSRCKATRYCSPACQRKHWRTHKASCVPVANNN